MMLDPNSRRIEPGGALEGSVGPSTSRILPMASTPFVNQGDALLGARLVGLRRIAFRRRAAGHEFDDVVELVVAEIRAEDFAKLFFLGCRNLEAEFLLQGGLGARGHDVLELGAQDFAHRAVKFRGLRHAHAMDFDADDVKAGAGKKINHVAGPAGGETEIVRLDQHQRALRLLVRSIDQRVLDHAAVGVRVAAPRA